MELSETQNSTQINNDRCRIAYWDVAKAVAIFCVVWGHCLQNMTTDKGYWLHDSLCQFILSFHMPLFMVISGYFAYYSFSKPFFIMMWKKAKQLILPSVSWYLVIAVAAMLFHRDFCWGRATDILMTLPYSMWFLKALFMCYLITLLGNWLYRWRPWSVWIYAVWILVIGEQLNYVSTISMLPFFLVGILAHCLENRLSRYLSTISIGCFIIFCWMTIKWDSVDYNLYINPLEYSWEGVKSMFVRILIGITGTGVILSIVKFVTERYRHSYAVTVLAELGTLTLGIYCIQVFFAEGLFKSVPSYFEQIIPTDTTFVYNYIITPFASVITIVLCIAVIKWVKKSRIAKLILLGE